MTNNIFIFDKNIIRKKRNRAAPHLDKHGFLFNWVSKQLTDRISFIKKNFPLALQIGNRTSTIDLSQHNVKKIILLDSAKNISPDILADEEILPFKANAFDLILSPLSLHTTNDLPGVLAQIQNCLKPDGFFIGALFGGETLYELREVMNEVEMNEAGGITPRISPFTDLQQAGSLVQRAGFNLPVLDSEKIIVTYDNIFKLMKDLRFMGESNSIIERKKSFTPRSFFYKVNDLYHEKFSEEDGRIKATFEVLFLSGWKNHASQQKPLRPGSAKKRLSEALITKEKKLPC